jgi:hypothetical protein
VSVECLTIVGWLNPSDIQNLSSIECHELDLTLDSVGAEQMYQLLEHIGRLVKFLGIIEDNEYKIKDKSDIILERILAACPNLEVFELESSRNVIQDNRYNMPPAAFKNYQL